MGAQHGDPIGSSTIGTSEPVAIAEAVRVVLAGIVTAGWLTIPDATINTIVSGLALALSILGSVLARRKVAPVPPQ
ncbi:hypothetical protein [Amycolatopsis sp. H20-H5]|uniref:hypothetical protein n=1 Tax=Amycolatopsis sp. H20-H5 TaxID=3046309 RepID=UPI002DB8E65F|nr:hypothetical protein [Amycolatopsis sp. H20-H5]MEC3974726.1 hypothetical protein [Amycolatopsis sp. H20-H5]